MRSTHTVLFRIPQWKRSHWEKRCRMDDNIKINVRQVVKMTWVGSDNGLVWTRGWTFGFRKNTEFLNQLITIKCSRNILYCGCGVQLDGWRTLNYFRVTCWFLRHWSWHCNIFITVQIEMWTVICLTTHAICGHDCVSGNFNQSCQCYNVQQRALGWTYSVPLSSARSARDEARLLSEAAYPTSELILLMNTDTISYRKEKF